MTLCNSERARVYEISVTRVIVYLARQLCHKTYKETLLLMGGSLFLQRISN